MRLIDADKLIESCHSSANTGREMWLSPFCEAIEEQPTAYDVDNVIDILKDYEIDNNKYTWCEYTEGFAVAIGMAIEVAKAGGIDE